MPKKTWIVKNAIKWFVKFFTKMHSRRKKFKLIFQYFINHFCSQPWQTKHMVQSSRHSRLNSSLKVLCTKNIVLYFMQLGGCRFNFQGWIQVHSRIAPWSIHRVAVYEQKKFWRKLLITRVQSMCWCWNRNLYALKSLVNIT